MKTILQHSAVAMSLVLFTFSNNSSVHAQIQVDADGVGAYSIANLTKVGNKMFFYGWNEPNTINFGLFTHDGTTSTFVKYLATSTQNPVVNVTKIIHDGYGKAYFHFNSVSGTMADGLVVSDGTEAGTQHIFTCKNPEWFTNCNGKIFFSTKLGTINDLELYVTDGTAAGTFLVKDIYPGTTGSEPESDGVEFNSEFWFRARSSTQSGYQLYHSDGTEAGTLQFVYPAELNGTITHLYLHNGYLYFVGRTTVGNKKALWRTDGTTTGTEKIFEGDGTIATFGIINSIGDKLLGISYETVLPYTASLYSIDAVTLEVTLLKYDLDMIWQQAGYGWMLDNKMVFVGKTPAEGHEPWVTDGTPAGTFMLADIRPGTANSNIYRSVGYSNNELYLNSQHSGILKTDGTAAGTSAIGVEIDNNFYNSFLSLDEEIYFLKDSPGRERKLYKLGVAATSGVSGIEQDKISVYPNPSNGIFHISNQNNQAITVTVYNITGEKVYENKCNDNNVPINLSNQSQGLYILNIDNGNSVVTQKIIIQ